jgi:Lrp/AsnC family leucine-responsive transcriptional regulator
MSETFLRLDEIDRKILRLLQTDCRLTMVEIAERVGLSASPCHRRIKIMEDAGLIKGYVALVDQRRLGLPVSVFVSIKLERQREKDLEAFSRAISRWPEVLECYLMTGHRDYLLRVVVEDLQAYEKFLKQKLTLVPGIASIESSFALDQIKYSIAVPV